MNKAKHRSKGQLGTGNGYSSIDVLEAKQPHNLKSSSRALTPANP